MRRFLHKAGQRAIRNTRRLLVESRTMAHREDTCLIFELRSNTFMPIGRHVVRRVLKKSASCRRLLGLDIKETTSVVFDRLIIARSDSRARSDAKAGRLRSHSLRVIGTSVGIVVSCVGCVDSGCFRSRGLFQDTA